MNKLEHRNCPGATKAFFAAIVGLSATANAQVEIVPFATTQFEHGDNKITDIDEQSTSDFLRLTVGIDSKYSFGRQKLFLDAAYGNVSYNGLPESGDKEYAFRTGAQWLLGRYLDGTVEALDQKQVPSFIDSRVKGNSIQEERRLTAAINGQLSQRWRVETTAISRNLDTPIIEFENFGFRDTTTRAGLRYEASTRLSLGAEYENSDGRFRNSGSPGLVPYTQRTPAGTIKYGANELGSVQLRLGRTERKQENEPEAFREYSGDISIERVLTGKTSVNFQARRRIDNFFGTEAGAFALIDTWNAGINWKATGKSTLYLDIGQSRKEFLSDGVGKLPRTDELAVTKGRIDRTRSIYLNLDNETLPWLTTSVYVKYDVVNSNKLPVDPPPGGVPVVDPPPIGFDFEGFLVGLKFEARFLEERP